MKIIVTGSLGHISKPMTQKLVEKGHSVTVISHSPERQKDIEALGATAAIGSLEDVGFLTTTFTGADAVYCMIPPSNLLHPDFIAKIQGLTNNYTQAISQSGVKRVVQLSSIGAHSDKENGTLAIYNDVEKILKQLQADVAITFIRPVDFYYNLFAFIETIKTQGIIASNYGGEDKTVWVSPKDIAAVIAEEITESFAGRKVRYVASDELTCNEIAGTLGAAIGKPDLKWKIIPDEQLFNGMVANGMDAKVAKGFVEMNASHHTGKLYEDYYRNRPTLGSIKMEDFAQEFAAVYNQK